MKLFKYSLIAALALSGALCACDDDNDYAPGASVSGDEVYFPISESASIDIPTDATSVAVSVNRLHDTDAITVPVAAVVTDGEGADATSIFTVPSQVAFAAGENETTLTIGVDFAKVTPDEEYSLTLTLEGDNTTPYGASSRTYTLVYSPWTEWEYVPGEEGVYTMSVYSSGEFEVPILTRQSLVNTNRVEYAVCDLFYANEDEEDGPLINFTYSMDLTNTIEVDGVECPIVTMSPLQLGENGAGTGNYLVLYDYRTWAVEVFGVSEANVDAWMERNDIAQSYFNPLTGTIAVDLILVGTKLEPGSYYSDGFDYIQLPGYKSYNLEFNYTGNFVDPKSEIEYAIVNAYKSEDVASYIYDIFAGELSGDDLDAAIESVKTNDDLEAVTDATTNLAFALEENGKYTVVGVGRDSNGEQVCKANYTFTFNSVQGAPVEQWNSLGYCEYTDGFINALFSVPTLTNDVEIQESTETPGLYRLVDPYKDWADQLGTDYLEGKHYIIFDASVPDEVVLYPTTIGVQISAQYGEFGVMSDAYYTLNQGEDATGLYGTLEDGVVTFPAGTLLVCMLNYQNGNWYYANVDPNNPGLAEDYEGDFNPYWGKGPFMIDMGDLAAAPAKKAPKATSPVDFSRVNKAATFKSSFRLHNDNKPMKTVGAKTLNDYRLANPRQFNF